VSYGGCSHLCSELVATGKKFQQVQWRRIVDAVNYQSVIAIFIFIFILFFFV